MLRLKNNSTTPADGFRFTHETGYVSRAIDPYTWMQDIDAHRKANKLPPVTQAQAEDQLCAQLEPQNCVQVGAGDRQQWVNTRLRWRDIAEATAAYVRLLITGETASQAEADRRAKICSSCFLRVTPQGCGTCVKLARLVTGAIASKKTPYDDNLVNKACAVCRCPVASIVHFPQSVLDKASSPEKQAGYPDFCWAKQGGVNYQAA